jgi:hypothetical protein
MHVDVWSGRTRNDRRQTHCGLNIGVNADGLVMYRLHCSFIGVMKHYLIWIDCDAEEAARSVCSGVLRTIFPPTGRRYGDPVDLANFHAFVTEMINQLSAEHVADWWASLDAIEPV